MGKPEMMTEETARKILSQSMIAKRKACWEEVGAVLKKHGFKLETNTVLTGDGRIVHQHSLVPIPVAVGAEPALDETPPSKGELTN